MPLCSANLTYRQRFDTVSVRETNEPLIEIVRGDLALKVYGLKLAKNLEGGAGLRVYRGGGVESRSYELSPAFGTLMAATEVD